MKGIAVSVEVMEVLLAQAKFEKFKASQHFQPKADTSDMWSLKRTIPKLHCQTKISVS